MGKKNNEFSKNYFNIETRGKHNNRTGVRKKKFIDPKDKEIYVLKARI